MGPKIEIIAPFNQAIELTKQILFRPFDLTKWLVIGFAAFLANLGEGGFNGLGNWDSDTGQSFNRFWQDNSWWLVPVIGAGIVVAVIIVVLLIWLSSRGRFIFTDCIVRNRAAIVAPWHEYRREGNSVFLFVLCSVLAMLVLGGVIALPAFLFLHQQNGAPPVPAIVLLCCLAFVFIVLVVLWSVTREFMIPVMYRQRCTALPAFTQVLGVYREYPGEILLFFLFCLVLALATAIAMVIFIVATCCIACCLIPVPYVGTVFLLPLFVFWRAYQMLFLRQFGAQFDAWGEAAPPLPRPPPPPAAPAPNDPRVSE